MFSIRKVTKVLGRQRVGVLVVLVALVSVACADGGGSGETADDPTETTADAAPGDGEETETEAATADGGGDLVAAFNQSITELDPAGPNNADQGFHLAATQIYDTLVLRDGNEFIPRLASSWEQPDDLTWVFTLRDDVQFHDGSPVEAQDVVASLERLAASETPLAPLWSALDSVEATDENTVTITTTEPVGTMLTSLTLMYVVPAEGAETEGFFSNPVGSGPFKVVDFLPEERLDLEANPDYWDGAPNLETLTFRDIPEEASRATALRAGEIDVTWDVSAQQQQQLEQEPNITLSQVPSYVYYFEWFNSSEPPFDDARVRRAMWHAVDTEAIAEQLFGGSGQLATAPIPSSVFGHCPQEPYEYDPELARELLEEAGVGDGFSADMIWNTGSGPLIQELADVLVSSWGEIGVDVNSENLERAQWIERLLALDWGIDHQTNTVLTGDADYTLGRLYVSEANRNGYANEELDELLLNARASTDQAEREQLYCDAIEIIWNDAVGMFPVELVTTYAAADGVTGLKPDPAGAPRFQNVDIES